MDRVRAVADRTGGVLRSGVMREDADYVADQDRRKRTLSKVIAVIILTPIALWFLALLAQLVGILR